MLLAPGFELTLRPMRYPQFYDMYRDAIKNTWTVEEVDFATDVADLARMTPAERHLIQRLGALSGACATAKISSSQPSFQRSTKAGAWGALCGVPVSSESC